MTTALARRRAFPEPPALAWFGQLRDGLITDLRAVLNLAELEFVRRQLGRP
ncbi:hypothetical protein I2W78_34235 [Streptomyces spinoverrucosus]|uniref:hypothetical protein n=1 Tax=Streptomyces spinoverrucosus TaxID=284043 RepID=UPI0018C37A03|nr:hypothetical protein [Streptomyces spinoverrucosus]MBG0856783.1 hypothetical protein [Streptomyces spinoverrucosus]